ncbi:MULTISPECIES: hypothetical protein [Roseobacteraceae]|jgi:hypothetical protein|uniref:Uncharacterized protein n=1 Tax=Celeribacter baekdonensis TaxID=875171 RepID=A0A1G7T744_9RHOB|nr:MULTISPECIES: hypothetical protein [Roseobacteraceae]AVW89997.1 hypothetical protein DA792_02030 [Celeribacter baekdonensis]AVW90077.1 hypothetical protein DA792_02510 [Celeribacter baekdonensis]KAB6717137.1 hypothetical protein C8029_05650 [Roseobacter sp. TSBP12]SDG31143.1 hypothetical protein SAMN04488117_11659 [Celeribacter baekdonensis]
MKRQAMAAVMGVMAAFGTPEKARAYDIDCAIMLCMAGGFPPSAVCARAYRTMIRRITPWPSLPPFGVCTFAHVPVELGGPGGEGELDTNLPEYEWLNRTHVIWFTGSSYDTNEDGRVWNWSVKSCDRENRTCTYLQRARRESRSWPDSFVSQSGQVIELPTRRRSGEFSLRSIMVEYGDYEGNMGHSEWFAY